jgi:hypothetical protein
VVERHGENIFLNEIFRQQTADDCDALPGDGGLNGVGFIGKAKSRVNIQSGICRFST